MKMEEKIAKAFGYPIILSGCIEETLIKRMEAAIIAGATRFLSFGVAGGLTHTLKSGDIVVGTWVLDRGQKIYSDKQWIDKFKTLWNKSTKLHFGGIDGTTHPLGKKEKLHEIDSIACAVDMESAIMARIAYNHNIPFSIIRTISDSIEVELPHAAMVALNLDGSINYKAIIKSLLKDITQIFDLIKLGFSSKKALNTLRLITNSDII
jgi:hypothetical protein